MTTYARAPGVVWRAGPEQIMILPIDTGPDGALDLLGAAATVWIALDEPGTLAELTDRLGDAGVVDDGLAAAIAELVERGLIVVAGAGR